MMTIAPASALPQLSAQPLPAEAAAPENAPPGQSFAQLLDQRRSHAAGPEHGAARDTQPAQSEGAAHSSAPATTAPTPTERGHAQESTAPRGPQRPAGPARDAGKSREAGHRSASAQRDTQVDSDRQAAATAQGKTAAAADDSSTVDPALAAWLAGLQLPDAAAAAQAAAQAAPTVAAGAVVAASAKDSERALAVGHDGAAAPGTIADSGQTGRAGEAAKPAAASPAGTAAELLRAGLSCGGDAQQAAGDAAADDADRDDSERTAVAVPAADTLKAAADKLANGVALPVAAMPQAAPNSTAGADAMQAAQAAQAAAQVQAPAAGEPGRDASRPLPVALDTPITSPEFPQAIGVRIGMLARDGIEHAELQLNPAEMGPVSVRIVVDGERARVDFGADIAATRQAIEASLPELAGALRDAGLTLTGGGVSQHAHPQREGQPGMPGMAHGSGRGDPGQPGDTPAPAQRRSVRAGGVDLYA